MNWLKAMLLKVFRGVLEEIVQESMEKVVIELNEEIDARFVDATKRAVLKSGIAMLRQRVTLVIRERL
jgi:hypothetical protein